jgi:L-alanine-DL-glutamate epimerase-like enolase superfamily enzyme
MDAFARGVPSGIEELGPFLIGQDPCQIKVINNLMDGVMRGHLYVKSPLDIACWDLMGQATGLSLCTLLGSRYVESYPVYRPISRQSPKKMADDVTQFRSEGYL